MAYAPSAIRSAATAITGSVGGAVFSGVVGDAAHSFGYHLARNQLPGTDYSVQLAADRDGNGDAASALDISLPPAQMIEVTARLRSAAKAGDPRLYALREFAGTLDGQTTFNRDLSNGGEGFGQWDDSHLWHIHLSGYRRYADDADAWRAIADVFTDTASIGGPLSEEDDMPFSEAELRKFINEEVGAALIASGTAGAGDWNPRQLANGDYTVGAKAKKLMVEAATEVVRSEGLSGAGDVSRLAAAIAAKLPAQGGGSLSVDVVEAALRGAFAELGKAAA